MIFSIDKYHRNYLEGIITIYNSETAFEAHIAQLSPQLFIELVENKSYFDPEGLFVAIKDGSVIGWVHACIAPGSEGHHNPENKVPRIRMLIFPSDQLKVGNALVSEANNWLKKSGQSIFLAMHAKEGYPFYRGLWLGGEPMGAVSLPHVQMVLEVGGYKNTQESVFMTIEIAKEPEVFQADLKIDFEESEAGMSHQPMRESWIGFKPMRIRAIANSETVGSISYVIIPYLAERLGAPCMNIWGMGIQEKYRRKGVATALVSYAMLQSYKQGARFASVGTQLWNSPAHATYNKLGFRPHCLVVGRTLELS
ncbi:GNAT family N-acetyltransferase [Candidatus Poribacteria bacterium]|nr:GNAT family N-acetyltransferase [Candidatus Poribacteria bacterium]